MRPEEPPATARQSPYHDSLHQLSAHPPLLSTLWVSLTLYPLTLAVELALQGPSGSPAKSTACKSVQWARPELASEKPDVVLPAGSLVGCGQSYTLSTSSAATLATFKHPDWALGANATSLTLPWASPKLMRSIHLEELDGSREKMRNVPSVEPAASSPSNSPGEPKRAMSTDASRVNVELWVHVEELCLA